MDIKHTTKQYARYDDAFAHAMELLDEGSTPQQIVELIPDFAQDLEVDLALVVKLRDAGEFIPVRKSGLDAVLRKVSESEMSERKKDDLKRGVYMNLAEFFGSKRGVYAGIGTLAVLLFLAGNLTFRNQRASDSPSPSTEGIALEEEIALEEGSLSTDLDDVGALADDGGLGGLDDDLAMLSGENEVDMSSVESVSLQLDIELNQLMSDLNEMDTLESDETFGSLESDLNTFLQ